MSVEPDTGTATTTTDTSAEPSRRRAGRRTAAAWAVAAVMAVTAVLLLTRPSDRDELVAEQRQQPPAQPAACAAPVGSSVPDCPVVPASVGETGTPGYLPPGWALYAEESIAVPTATADRIQSWQRRYGPPDGQGMIYIGVDHGDVTDPREEPAAYEGTVKDGLRPGTPVLEAVGPGSERFLWMAQDRVVVDVEFRGTGLPRSEHERVLRSIR